MKLPLSTPDPNTHPNGPGPSPQNVKSSGQPSMRRFPEKVSRIKRAIGCRRSTDGGQSLLTANKHVGEFFSKLSDAAWISIRVNTQYLNFTKDQTIFKTGNPPQ